MNESTIPATLGAAIMTEPFWLQLWLLVLSAVLLGSILFAIRRDHKGWHIRKECFAILLSAVVAVPIMDWLYANYGYVRLLGLGHLLAWTPAYAYILSRRKRIGHASWFGKYIHVYLLIAGISLFIDTVDVVRYLLGDGDLYLRWG